MQERGKKEEDGMMKERELKGRVWLNDNGMRIINGTTERDAKGDYTQIGVRGRIVIDYVTKNEREI